MHWGGMEKGMKRLVEERDQGGVSGGDGRVYMRRGKVR